MFMLHTDGTNIGRFKVRKLMGELKLISKQPGPLAYKKSPVGRPDIPMCRIESSTFRRRTRSDEAAPLAKAASVQRWVTARGC